MRSWWRCFSCIIHCALALVKLSRPADCQVPESRFLDDVVVFAGYSVEKPSEKSVFGLMTSEARNIKIDVLQITVSYPRDRDDYHPPEGVDLRQWLKDHFLIGSDEGVPDVQIAGTTAIHLRHERSPQSYAFDRYYFAWAGQLYEVTIGHQGDKEDWELYNHFLQSIQFEK
jgi:hypothetical protein